MKIARKHFIFWDGEAFVRMWRERYHWEWRIGAIEPRQAEWSGNENICLITHSIHSHSSQINPPTILIKQNTSIRYTDLSSRLSGWRDLAGFWEIMEVSGWAGGRVPPSFPPLCWLTPDQPSFTQNKMEKLDISNNQVPSVLCHETKVKAFSIYNVLGVWPTIFLTVSFIQFLVTVRKG